MPLVANKLTGRFMVSDRRLGIPVGGVTDPLVTFRFVYPNTAAIYVINMCLIYVWVYYYLYNVCI